MISLIKFIGTMVILLNIHSGLALCAAASLPFMLVFAYVYNGKLKRAFKRNRDRIADINAQLADTICEKIGVQLDNVIAEKITEQVSTKVIKEMDYRMRLQDDEAEERFRKLDETLFMRRKKSREQKEAAASRLPWKRKHKM